MLSMDCKNRGGNVFVRIYSTTYIYIDVNLILCAYVDCMLARCNIYKSFNMYIPFVILYIYKHKNVLIVIRTTRKLLIT